MPNEVPASQPRHIAFGAGGPSRATRWAEPHHKGKARSSPLGPFPREQAVGLLQEGSGFGDGLLCVGDSFFGFGSHLSRPGAIPSVEVRVSNVGRAKNIRRASEHRCAPFRLQAGAQPVSQPPAPGQSRAGDDLLTSADRTRSKWDGLRSDRSPAQYLVVGCVKVDFATVQSDNTERSSTGRNRFIYDKEGAGFSFAFAARRARSCSSKICSVLRNTSRVRS